MPDGFSFRVRYGDGGSFGHHSLEGDEAGFRAAVEAAGSAAAGKDEAEVRELLAAELRARNIALPPPMIGLLAFGIADSGASVVIGGPEESYDEPHYRPGPVGSLVGKVIGRVFARQAGELARGVFQADPVLSRLTRADPRIYVPEAGAEPAAADVVADPDLAERMPWLFELPPGRPRDTPVWFHATLAEDDGAVVVRDYGGRRLGVLRATDAAAYLPHLRSARAQDKAADASGSVRITGHRSLRITIRLRTAGQGLGGRGGEAWRGS